MKLRSPFLCEDARAAGVLGQVIIHETVISNSERWYRYGFRFGGNVITIGSWIDNIYIFGNKLSNTLIIAREFEQHIARKWGLQIKPSSKCCMVCKGNPDKPPEGTEWPLAKTMMVLGHIVQNDGGIREDWNHTVASMWRCYWSSVGSKRAKNLSAAGKALLLQRAVVSNFLWKISRWPFQKSVAILLDKTQCKMLSHILPCPIGVGETVDHYCRRRARLARNVSIESGAWSKLWCNRVGRWDQHVRRGVVYHFCHDLMLHHSSQWLLLQRAVFTTENSER